MKPLTKTELRHAKQLGFTDEQYRSWRKSTRRSLNRSLYKQLRKMNITHMDAVDYMRSVHKQATKLFGSAD